jgi:hypothetical protein
MVLDALCPRDAQRAKGSKEDGLSCGFEGVLPSLTRKGSGEVHRTAGKSGRERRRAMLRFRQCGDRAQ